MSRRELDRYDTPTWMTRALIKSLPEMRGGLLVDPCCGNGNMARQIASEAPFDRFVLNDLDRRLQADSYRDASVDALIYAETPDWIVSNPPFSEAGEIVHMALRAQPRGGVAMLLRLTFAEPCGPTKQSPKAGRLWLAERPWNALIALPRHSFTGDGTDTAACAWFVWVTGRPTRNRAITRETVRSAGQVELPLFPSPSGQYRGAA